MIYLDTSALLKLVVREPRTRELREYLAGDPDTARFSSMLTNAELLRATLPHGARIVTTARTVLSSLHLVDVSRDLLERAGTLNLGVRLRTLDAIHVTTAAYAQERLKALITYDERMSAAAKALGLPVVAP